MRTFDPFVHNRIANIPSVRPWLGDDGQPVLDFSGAIEYRDVYWFLHNEEQTAAVLFEQSAPRVFELHTFFAPECRGRLAKVAGMELCREMFTQHGAHLLWGQTPADNRAALVFNRWIGAKSGGTRNHPTLGPVRIFYHDRSWLGEHPTE